MPKEKKDESIKAVTAPDKVTDFTDKLKPIVQRKNLKCNKKKYKKGNELMNASAEIEADLLKKGIIKYQ